MLTDADALIVVDVQVSPCTGLTEADLKQVFFGAVVREA
jgi:hypothetical protein